MARLLFLHGVLAGAAAFLSSARCNAAPASLELPTQATALPASVWPAPVAYACSQDGDGPAMSSQLRYVVTGAGATSHITTNATARYLPFLTKHGASTRGQGQGHGQGHNQRALSSLVLPIIKQIAIAVGGDEVLGQATDYSYSIKLASRSTDTISVVAASPYGVAYALETLSQLISDGGKVPWT